jgi:hypothetical protein
MAVEQKLVRKALEWNAGYSPAPPMFYKSQKARSRSGDKRSEETFKCALAADALTLCGAHVGNGIGRK